MKKSPKRPASIPPSKFYLYEQSVQSPNWQVEYLPQFHQWLTKKKPYSFREDFCGSGKISCEWVKQGAKYSATGLDLDTETLTYANSVNRAELRQIEQRRVQFLKQDVLKPTREKFDMIGAFNFSFFDFHERETLLKYAKAAYRSLEAKGTFFLELAGGPDFLISSCEAKTFSIPKYGKFKKVWEQHQYDPISQVIDYAIHFQLKDGTWLNDAFTYHWRIWSIREVRDILLEAGFRDTAVIWDPTEHEDDFDLHENAEAKSFWVAYVVGVKK
jgi:SAM-dependent methyltransferase